MRSLGDNHGTSSHLKDLETMYKMASIVDDGERMERVIEAINRSNYSQSSKDKALRNLAKWERIRSADKVLER